MKKIYALTNLIVIIVLVAWNYAANAIGINGNSIGSVSAELSNLFTPAGYAFSIWGIIFLGLLAHGIYQVRVAFSAARDQTFILQMGPWLIIANLANAAWVWFWLNEQIGISVIMMLVILISLVIVVLRLNMERWDAPINIIAWVWWPICFYSGWIAVATIANVAAWLTSIGWEFLFSEVAWTVIMVIVAALLNLAMILTRNMREFALVGVWALAAISVRHWEKIPVLQWTAFFSAVVLFAAITIHAYRNRATNPLAKLMQFCLIILTLFTLPCACRTTEKDQSGNHLLILSGRNNHDWERTTAVLTRIFDESGIFSVEVTLRPDTLDIDDLRNYHAVVSNWNSWPENDLRWPEAAERGLLEYLEEGGGLVFFHASTSVFYNWPGFGEMTTGAWVEETHHGPLSEVKVQIEDRTHPVTRGLSGFYTFDELWINAERNPAFRVLGSASLHEAGPGSEDLQPAISVCSFGKGRVFHTILGHDERAMRNSGFRTLITRGAEWAATGEVHAPVPAELSITENREEGENYFWMETDTTLGLRKGRKTIWQYNYNTIYRKPFFHPVCPGKTSTTCLSPDDHPWHLGQWFSWKYINDLNYWEFDRSNFESEGVTEVVNTEFHRAPDFSADLALEMEYHPPDGESVLREMRIIHIQPPETDRIVIDYDMQFEALAERVELDRTPIVGEPGGKTWGGYAGLSIRFSQDMMSPYWISSGGKGLEMNGRSDDWLCMGFTGLDGRPSGSAIFVHRESRREGAAWYLINQHEQPFYYFSPAYLYLKPIALQRGEQLRLQYRVLHLSADISAEMLTSEYHDYISKTNHLP